MTVTGMGETPASPDSSIVKIKALARQLNIKSYINRSNKILRARCNNNHTSKTLNPTFEERQWKKCIFHKTQLMNSISEINSITK